MTLITAEHTVLFNDVYYKQRGNTCRIYDLHCRECDRSLGVYQKDGKIGRFRRLYLDRIHPQLAKEDQLWVCDCGENLGYLIQYDKEPRRAYQLFVDAVIVKTTSRVMRMMNYFGKF